MRTILLAVIAAVALVGCANPYADFYQGNPDARKLAGYVPQGDFQILTGRMDRTEVLELFRRGYALVGESNFTAGTSSVTEKQLRDQAQKVGAHIVLIRSQYAGTVTGAMPLVMPTTSTTYTTGSATAYGRGGPVTAYGNSTSTTYGSTTTMVPYSVERSAFNAAYYARVRFRFGVMADDLTAEQRRERASNLGVQIAAVANDSPAYRAEMLPGDIITEMDGKPIRTPAEMLAALEGNEGKTISVTLYRGTRAFLRDVPIVRY